MNSLNVPFLTAYEVLSRRTRQMLTVSILFMFRELLFLDVTVVIIPLSFISGVNPSIFLDPPF